MTLLKRLWIALSAERWLDYFHQVYTDGETKGNFLAKLTTESLYKFGYNVGYNEGKTDGIIKYLENCWEESV